MQLSQYTAQVQDLVHDPNAQVWPLTQIQGYVNEARDRIATDTKCLRQILTPTQFPALQFTQGFEFFNPQTFLDPSIGPFLVGTLGITVIINNVRKPLGYKPYTWLSSNFRQFTNYQSYPTIWSRVSPTQYVIAPVPSTTYQCEFDVSVTPNKLIDDSTVDQIPVPFQEAAQYYGAFKAKINQQQLQEAQLFYGLYVSEIRRIAASHWGVVNQYPYGDR